MEYDHSRRCIPHSHSFPEYYYNERDEPRGLSQITRTNPREYHNGHAAVIHDRSSVGRGESPLETGPARRRIAVAVSYFSLQSYRD